MHAVTKKLGQAEGRVIIVRERTSRLNTRAQCASQRVAEAHAERIRYDEGGRSLLLLHSSARGLRPPWHASKQAGVRVLVWW